MSITIFRWISQDLSIILETRQSSLGSTNPGEFNALVTPVELGVGKGEPPPPIFIFLYTGKWMLNAMLP